MLSEVSQRKTNTIYHLHVKSKKKYNKLVNIKKKEDTENKLVVTSCRGEYRVGEWLVQTTGRKIGSRIIVQHWEYSQYFAIIINGNKPLKY